MIVITGATGRTGRAATEALLSKGERVRVVGRDGNKMHRSWNWAPKHSSETLQMLTQ